jgi:hypothetical protein
MRPTTPLWALRSVAGTSRLLLGCLARFPGGTYFRFLILPDWCKRAIDRGDYALVNELARELLALAIKYPNDWNTGNAIHQGHLALGRAALVANNLPIARAELLAAAHTLGSPQLSSFGPGMHLAKDLLLVGERDSVLAYLELCRGFWKLGDDRVAEWTSAIAEGRTPDFQPNVVW